MESKKSKKSYVLVTLLMFVTIFGTVFYFSSCKKDPCKGISCQNGGTSVSSGNNCNCNCLTGYEGNLCQTKTVEKLVGNYSISNMTYCYTVGTISASTSFVDRINFYSHQTCCTLTFYATVSGNNVTIPSQPQWGGTISGSGTINSTSSNLVITLNITVNGANSCFTNGGSNVTWTKQ